MTLKSLKMIDVSRCSLNRFQFKCDANIFRTFPREITCNKSAGGKEKRMSAFGHSRITTERRSRAICMAGIRAVVKPINPITRHDVRIWINGEHGTFGIMPALSVIKRYAADDFPMATSFIFLIAIYFKLANKL